MASPASLAGMRFTWVSEAYREHAGLSVVSDHDEFGGVVQQVRDREELEEALADELGFGRVPERVFFVGEVREDAGLEVVVEHLFDHVVSGGELVDVPEVEVACLEVVDLDLHDEHLRVLVFDFLAHVVRFGEVVGEVGHERDLALELARDEVRLGDQRDELGQLLLEQLLVLLALLVGQLFVFEHLFVALDLDVSLQLFLFELCLHLAELDLFLRHLRLPRCAPARTLRSRAASCTG